ncbi:MAG: trypsin-like peptidase domain-containing protein [Paenibacillaceae bacterium]
MKRVFILTAVILCLFSSVAYAASMYGDFNGNPIVKVTADQVELKVNGTPAVMYNGNTLIPINMLRQLGAAVNWDSKTYSVDIAFPKPVDVGLEAFKKTKTLGGTYVAYSFIDNHYYATSNFYYKKGPDQDWPQMLTLFKELSNTQAEYLKIDYFDAKHEFYGEVSIDRASIVDLIAGKLTEADIIDKRTTTFALFKNPLTTKEIAKLIDRVGYIITYDQYGNSVSQGSGFLIGNGIFITNSHVVEGSATEKVTINGKTYDNKGWYMFYNTRSDLYGIRLSTSYDTIGKTTGLVPKNALELTTTLPEIGEKVYAIGSPSGLENTLTEGIVSGIRTIDGIKYIQHTATVEPGSSGGVLLNEFGQAIGVNTWKVEDAALYFAVPMIYVTQELDILALE